ncbi:hypothetical protein VPHD151_0195 [Vibrio phage D151]
MRGSRLCCVVDNFFAAQLGNIIYWHAFCSAISVPRYLSYNNIIVQ